MREWIVTFLIALPVAAAAGCLLMRRRRNGGGLGTPGTDGADEEIAAITRREAVPDAAGPGIAVRQDVGDTGPLTAPSAPAMAAQITAPAARAWADPRVGHARAPEPEPQAAPIVFQPVPNSTILPHPDDTPLATLEFDGPPGRVSLLRGEVVIGRHSDDDIQVPDVRVSRHHARLVVASRRSVEIHNLTAARAQPNPMLVNGESRDRATVTDGDVITLGGVAFRLRLSAAG